MNKISKFIVFLAIMLFVVVGLGCLDNNNGNESENESGNATNTTNISHKQMVEERLKSIETGDPTSNAYMHPTKYIQHNLAIRDGHAGFEAVMAQLPEGSAKVNTVRVFQDGDYVWAHTDYDFFGPQIGFDIFRFEGGLIVEHWDNLQVTPSANNPSNRSMIDGTVRIIGLDKTEENKDTVSRFVNEVLIDKNFDRLESYFEGNRFIQHNPEIGDGVAAFRTALERAVESGSMTYDQVHKVLGEGDFVLVIGEGTLNGEPVSYYSLFRISDGKIAEHWDVIEVIIPENERQNNNGKFNFPY